MRRLFLRLVTAIQLTRLTIAFGAVSDIWFVILLTQAGARGDAPVGLRMPAGADVASMGLFSALAAGVIIAVGLFGCGASLNEVLDVRHGATFSPDRPIPAGRIKVGQAIVVTVGALIVAVLGGVWIGTWSVCLTLLTAAGLLFYNATGKYIPAVGVVTIGLIHAAHFYIANHAMPFALPVWLVMTHAMAIAGVVHVLEEKRPALDRRAMIAAVAGWAFWSLLLFTFGGFGERHVWPEGVPVWRLVYPITAVLGFVLVAWWKTGRADGRVAAEKLKRYGAMWQSLYGAAWLCALGLGREAMWIGLFAVAGFIAMTLIKEVTGLTGRPLAYR